MGKPGSVDDPAWEELPAELLLKIAHSCSGTSGMRGACRAWRTGLESVITKLCIESWPAKLSSQLACRFPLLECFEVLSHLYVPKKLDALRDLSLSRLALKVPSRLSDRKLQHIFDKLRELRVDELVLWEKGFPVKEDILSRLHGLPIFRLDVKGITDSGLLKIRTLPLTSLRLCDGSEEKMNINDSGLVSLRGMRLREFIIFTFTPWQNLTDRGLSAFQGMPLTLLELHGCNGITNEGLEVFRGMSLTSFSFYPARNITDAGLEVLRGMPLTHISLRGCKYPHVTPRGLENLRGMPLTSLVLDSVTDLGLEVFKGMGLTRICLFHCPDLTDIGFNVLRGMPVIRLDLNSCSGLTDDIFENVVQGLPLKKLSLDGSVITDEGLGWLVGSPVTKISLVKCHRITPEGVLALAGMPLRHMYIRKCDKLMDTSVCKYGAFIWWSDREEGDRRWESEFMDACKSKSN